jgi:hypothetical protein
MANVDIKYGFIVNLTTTLAINMFDITKGYFLYLLPINFKFKVEL